MDDIIGKFCTYAGKIWKVESMKMLYETSRPQYGAYVLSSDYKRELKYYLKRIGPNGHRVTASVRLEQLEILEGDIKTLEALYS